MIGTALQVGDSAPDVGFADVDGAPHRLSEFWRDRPTILVFLRHFG